MAGENPWSNEPSADHPGGLSFEDRTRDELLQGPPWILGHRGSPREAPENTLESLRRALEWGLDGVEYDVRACASGEVVLLHDETLERTTDATGALRERSLPELFGIDAGGWFHKRYEGEPLPLLDEALDLGGGRPGVPPIHMVEIKEEGIVSEVARSVSGRGLAVRVASFSRSVCLEARDAGLETMFLVRRADEESRRFVRDERLTATGVGPYGWRTPAGEQEWSGERWAWSVDEPDDLLEACRRPLSGFNTNEPQRALATRALVHLAPQDGGDYPIGVPELEVDGEPLAPESGEWCGRWQVEARVRNPFGFPTRVAVDLAGRGGAYEVEGLPALLELEPGAEVELAFELAGGSWSPGSDPCLAATYRWRAGPGRPVGRLTLDAPLHRRRTLSVDEEATRVPLLRERPGEAAASMTVRRRGGELLIVIENPGGLAEARAWGLLDGEVRLGSRGVRFHLPADFASRGELDFCCGFEGWEGEGAHRRRRLRRWAGGLPPGLESGVPGRLVPR